MTNYILRRLWQGVISIMLLLTLVFFLSRTTGNPLDLLVPIDATPETIANISRQNGLDKPLIVQYLYYIGNLFTGDMGTSIRYRQPVWDLFKDAFPNSLRLVIPSFISAIVIGIPLGVLAATSRLRIARRLLAAVGVVGMATPLFWLAILLIFLFSVKLGVLPSSQMGGIDHYVMPVAAMTMFIMAGLLRLTRSSILDAMDSEYVKLARLKGLSENRVIWKHALRNSLTAAVAFLGVLLSLLLTGSTVIETVFAWPGTGRLTYDALVSRDYPLVQGIVLITAIFIILVNLVVDILHAYLEPRIRL
ncbi:MAG: ABC transporter permease subunit [Streptosporangiales bacterium]|nr:ABC transporter permease subunit [Streptosporangiales bacterium]